MRVYLSPPHMTGNEQKYIKEAFLNNWIAPVGPNIDAFEKEMNSYLGEGEAVAVSSGTAAIHLALILLNVTKGDRVFCPTLTFVASANPIIYQGAEPVFIDSDPDSWNMSPVALEKAFQEASAEGKLPKAVIIVHLYGQMAKLDEIIPICNKYGVPIIEDAAESLGSYYQGLPSGTFGEFGIFSFNGNKIITTSSGGMLICKNKEIADKARFLATQAKDPAIHYQHSELGFNYRMSNILAGIGRAQLEVIEDRVNARRAVFKSYYEELHHYPGISFMEELPGTRPNRWLSTLTINEEEAGISIDAIFQSMYEENIEIRPVWKPLHLQPLFKNTICYSHDDGENVAERLFHTGICLPSGSNLSIQDQMRVIHSVKKGMAFTHKVV